VTCIAQKVYKTSEIKMFLLLAKQIAAAVPLKQSARLANV